MKAKSDVARILKELRAHLAQEPSQVAARELIDFLESGADAATGMGFRVGPSGSLTEQPSLRVAALDWLGEFSPSDAAAYAETVFQSSDSADEWAVALRNLGRSRNARENPSFTDAVRELFVREQWRVNPTEGYFEAFDAVVFSGRGEFVRELVDLARESPALAPVASAALDNLVLQSPGSALSAVEAEAGRFDSLPKLRASLMARANVLDPAQRRVLEDYLAGGLGSGEAAEFARIFPHASRVLGHRLLSEDQPPPVSELAARAAAALSLIDEWRASPKFTNIQSELARIHTRLAKQVNSARRGGLLPYASNNTH